MTAPAESRMPLAFDSYLGLGSSYNSPASTAAFDPDFSWDPMPPHQESDVTASEEPQDDGGLIFITGASPADFKTKTNMNIVRKKAMDSFLKGDGKSSSKSKSSAGRSRFSSVDSESRGSNKSKLSVSGSFVLPAVPIFLRCEKGVPIPYDAYMPQPFQSIGKSLDPFRTMFQASHPGVSVEELKFHCSRYFGTRALGKYWIPTALSYPHTFLGTLCLATAYHDVIHELELESVQTIALRQEVIHLVGRNMLDPETRVSDHNIMAIIQLIISEVIGREESGLTWHENGIEGMICQRGGLEKLAPAPSNTTTLLKDLRATIENSNISACWGDMAGVLLWIGLVVGAASKKSESKIHRKYFSALTMRAGVMLCFEHPESIHSTMVKMCEVVEALGAGKQRKDEGAGKRRRV
ncbi:hypothetical protein SNOG_06894 [Parastagonospora nodorum SN15]|uniref:Transcription factor domain-containing protein n=1 Tax=Phaeosphaeria nodorum (strain SN15 / ATCC MYA-4574 / FGSC 10173) TaxID=321614 RepID=Q0UMX0_PHANO|nr:hypothetical protein SNOG_06894 [Parastagonospora nodorum SN15]EAT85545.2 hypothetical protein SNOG_06894 [Parastagonospora nodorum SN15]